MKKVFVSLVVLMFAMSAFAADGPIDKGSMILEGSAYFQTSGGDAYKNSDDESPTTIAFMPSIGYFIAPSIMVGAQLQFSNYSLGDYSTTRIGFGPTVAYYFNMDPERTEVKGSLYPYIRAFFLYGQHKWDTGSSDGTDKVLSIGGQGGIMYMLSNAVAANANLLFQTDSYKDDGADESISGTVIQFGIGFTAFVWN